MKMAATASWGELSCFYHWLPREESPCTPELSMCNKKCQFYKSAIEEEAKMKKMEMKCVKCGCTDSRACIVKGIPCRWITKDFKTQKGLCSACAKIQDD